MSNFQFFPSSLTIFAVLTRIWSKLTTALTICPVWPADCPIKGWHVEMHFLSPELGFLPPWFVHPWWIVAATMVVVLLWWNDALTSVAFSDGRKNSFMVRMQNVVVASFFFANGGAVTSKLLAPWRWRWCRFIAFLLVMRTVAGTFVFAVVRSESGSLHGRCRSVVARRRGVGMAWKITYGGGVARFEQLRGCSSGWRWCWIARCRWGGFWRKCRFRYCSCLRRGRASMVVARVEIWRGPWWPEVDRVMVVGEEKD